MLFSICVPQYNRTSFLIRALDILREQTFRDFKVCISDGGSTDGRGKELQDYLEGSSFRYSYQVQPQRAAYDENLRTAISVAQGRYCILMGNDDMLASSGTLDQIAHLVAVHDFPEVVVTNYHELSTGRDFRRVSETGLIGKGIDAAIANFRNCSFVSGILLDRELAQRYSTEKWDGSEMYQTFLATRILAGGGRLLGIADTVVLKDIQIEGEEVDSYARRPKIQNSAVQERQLPLAQLGRVVMDALSPCLTSGEVGHALRRVFSQLILFTYPPWLIEYRKVQSWRYAAGVALGMRPRNILSGLHVDWPTKTYLCALYAIVTFVGLIFPIRLFERLKPRLHAFAKRQ